ncbi:MAG: TetR/AcrR family transcriptional regulator [Pseudomonadaceae bacterium]|nr:TetR/AcrR family transcriptional regulator [Pseudomonadaceae bacterium]
MKRKQSSNDAAVARRPVGRPRRDGRPHLTRERVFDVCARLVAEHGFSGTGVRMIASALDASPASLFNLFGSKVELFNELIAFAAAPAIEFHESIRREDVPAAVALYKSVFEEAKAVAASDYEHTVMFYLPELRQPQFERAQAIRAAMVGHYSTLIKQGVSSGELHTNHSGLAAEQVFQLTETSIVAPRLSVSPQRQARQAADFCLRGLLLAPEKLDAIREQADRISLAIELPLSHE